MVARAWWEPQVGSIWDHIGRANRSVQGEHPMATVSLEERVAVLEAEVAQLKRERQSATKMLLPWWERRFGAFKDDPIYDAAMRLGAEYRTSQPTPEDANVSV